MRGTIVLAAPFLLLVALGGSVAGSALQTEGAAGVAEQIWALEDLYNAAFLAADHETIMSLWHDGFLGWPSGEPQPADREAGARYLEQHYNEPATWTITVERQGIKVLNDAVINHYIVSSKWTDANGIEQRRASKVTHTWVREAAAWKILGGMSAPLEP